LSILKVNSCSIDQGSGEIWTVQTDLQQIYSKSDSLLGLPCALNRLFMPLSYRGESSGGPTRSVSGSGSGSGCRGGPPCRGQAVDGMVPAI